MKTASKPPWLKKRIRAGHFSRTLKAVQNKNPKTRIEVLIPDFKGQKNALVKVMKAKPSVLNHNLETVPRLYN